MYQIGDMLFTFRVSKTYYHTIHSLASLVWWYVFLFSSLSCQDLSLEASVCKAYIHSGPDIFTNHTRNESSIQREERAIGFVNAINHQIPLGSCRDLAYSVMCHDVYPYCAVTPGKPTPRKLCKGVCQEFLTGRCKGYLSEATPLYSMLVEGCDDREHTGGDSPECIPLSYQTYRNGSVNRKID